MDLKAKPFYLSDERISWVEKTLAGMSLEEKIGQLFFPVGMSGDDEKIFRMVRTLKPCGIMYRSCPAKEAAEAHSTIQDMSRIPMFLAANLESGGDGLVSEGTSFGSNMNPAATGDPEVARRLGVVCAREAGAVGGNMAFAPVVDINFNCNNPIANIRSYGDRPETVLAMGKAYVEGAQSEGCAVTIKHFPGDGVDDRDQHVTATINSLSVEEWDASFGLVYRGLIEAGATGLMVGHIMQPAYSRFLRPGIADRDLRPATLAPELIQGLLRERLGFNGLVLTDATPMAGFSWSGRREDIVPEAIAAGCDVFLFNRSWEEDYRFMMAGYERGVLTPVRLTEAVTRILALKAALGLPERQAAGTLVPRNLEVIGCAEHKAWAKDCADRSVTLAKDTQGLLPLDPTRHKRILFYPFVKRSLLEDLSAADKQPLEQKMIALLRNEGFEVTEWDFQKEPTLNFEAMRMSVEELRARFDLVLYFVNYPTSSNQTTVRIQYKSFVGFDAPWQSHDLPTLMVSTANPYHLYDAPMVKTLVNAYGRTDALLKAVVDKLVGRSPFKGVSPVDAYCGKWETRL